MTDSTTNKKQLSAPLKANKNSLKVMYFQRKSGGYSINTYQKSCNRVEFNLFSPQYTFVDLCVIH